MSEPTGIGRGDGIGIEFTELGRARRRARWRPPGPARGRRRGRHRRRCATTARSSMRSSGVRAELGGAGGRRPASRCSRRVAPCTASTSPDAADRSSTRLRALDRTHHGDLVDGADRRRASTLDAGAALGRGVRGRASRSWSSAPASSTWRSIRARWRSLVRCLRARRSPRRDAATDEAFDVVIAAFRSPPARSRSIGRQPPGLSISAAAVSTTVFDELVDPGRHRRPDRAGIRPSLDPGRVGTRSSAVRRGQARRTRCRPSCRPAHRRDYPPLSVHDIRAPTRQCVALGAAIGAAGSPGGSDRST